MYSAFPFPSRDGRSLVARAALPVDRRPVATAVVVHEFAGPDGTGTAGLVARELIRHGFAVMDLPFGPVESPSGGGRPPDRVQSGDDIVDAARAFSQAHGSPMVLIGHSGAGAAALEAAQGMDAVAAVATIGAPFREGSRLADLGRPLLVMHAPGDTVIGIDQARLLYRAAVHPKSFVSLDAADHGLSREADALYVGRMLHAWVSRYVTTRTEPDPDLDAHDHRAFVRIGRDRYRTEIRAGGHAFLSDEPEHLDGTDAGPTPYDLLIGGLGACTAITIRMYADRKEWPVEAVEVRLTHRKLPADGLDCEKATVVGRKIDVIDREITLYGDLDEVQRARLVEIANRCPVHRTLEGGPCVRTFERLPETVAT